MFCFVFCVFGVFKTDVVAVEIFEKRFDNGVVRYFAGVRWCTFAPKILKVELKTRTIRQIFGLLLSVVECCWVFFEFMLRIWTCVLELFCGCFIWKMNMCSRTFLLLFCFWFEKMKMCSHIIFLLLFFIWKMNMRSHIIFFVVLFCGMNMYSHIIFFCSCFILKSEWILHWILVHCILHYNWN